MPCARRRNSSSRQPRRIPHTRWPGSAWRRDYLRNQYDLVVASSVLPKARESALGRSSSTAAGRAQATLGLIASNGISMEGSGSCLIGRRSS